MRHWGVLQDNLGLSTGSRMCIGHREEVSSKADLGFAAMKG